MHSAFGAVDPKYPFRYAQHQLNTSDLNGDGRTDLISSPGVIALTLAPSANQPPAVFAGPTTPSSTSSRPWICGPKAPTRTATG